MNLTAAPGSGRASPEMSTRYSPVLLQAAVQVVQYSSTGGAGGASAVVQLCRRCRCSGAAVQEVQQCRSVGSAAAWEVQMQQCRSVGGVAVWEVQEQEVPSGGALLRNSQVPKIKNNFKPPLRTHSHTGAQLLLFELFHPSISDPIGVVVVQSSDPEKPRREGMNGSPRPAAATQSGPAGGIEEGHPQPQQLSWPWNVTEPSHHRVSCRAQESCHGVLGDAPSGEPNAAPAVPDELQL